jgi:adenine-specific DNA-methyltransferase
MKQPGARGGKWVRLESTGEGEEGHRLWRGENLEVMAELKRTKARYDLVYLDPPYNTKRGLRYKDKFGERGEHATWVEFMRGRLEMVRDLLEEEGLVAVSIDLRELAHLTLLMNEIFGEGNRMAVVTVKVKAGAGLSVNSIMDVCEYVVVYARDAGKWRGRILRREEVMVERGEYTRTLTAVDAGERCGGGEQITVWRHEGRVSPLEAEAFARGEIAGAFCTTNSQGVRKYTGLVPKRGIYRVVDTENGKTTWFHNGRVLLWLEDRARVEAGRVIRQVRETNLWVENWHQGLGAEGGVSFTEGKKPVAMLRRILSWVGGEARILDPFAGSASMIQAAAEMNRDDGGRRWVDAVTNDEGRICTEVAWPRVCGVFTGRYADGREVEAVPGGVGLYGETGRDQST